MARQRRKRRPARSNRQEEYPGWMWLLFGLAIGLSVAFAIYMKDRENSARPLQVAHQPASMNAPIDDKTRVARQEAKEEPESEPRFTFYDTLPNFEVVVPEEESDVRRDRQTRVVEEPGAYVLQAGSFSTQSDADRRKAEIALLGVESRIQRVTIDDRTYFRVRIGPIRNLDELNRVREQLRQARIDVLRIRLGD